jgi:hypothetical protein
VSQGDQVVDVNVGLNAVRRKKDTNEIVGISNNGEALTEYKYNHHPG